MGDEGQPNNDWRPFLTDELKGDPVVAGFAEKASEKDIGALIKTTAHMNKRLGTAVNFPGKDANPADVQSFREKVYESGAFARPPGSPGDYQLKKPDDLPEGFGWSDDLAGKYATILHKHGIPKEAVGDLMPLLLESLTGQSDGIKVDKEASMAELRREHGAHFEERQELVKRMMKGLVRDDAELAILEQSGLADHPKFLSVLMRLAPLAAQDSTFMSTIQRTGGEIPGDEARAEYAKILNDKTHPMHEGLMRGDPKVDAYLTDLYQRAYGTGQVPIGGGAGASG